MTLLNKTEYSIDYTEFTEWLKHNLEDAGKDYDTQNFGDFLGINFPNNDPEIMKQIAFHAYNQIQMPDILPDSRQALIKKYSKTFL